MKGHKVVPTTIVSKIMRDMFANLTPQWKAAIRTALQSVLAAISVVVLAFIASLTAILSGDTVDLAGDMSNAARLAGLVLLGGAGGFWGFVMNRPPRTGADTE